MGRLAFKVAAALAVFVVFIFLWPPGSLFLKNIVLDGQLQDWRGRALLTSGKAGMGADNIFESIYWATNENEQRLYFAVNLQNPVPAGGIFPCRLYLDINDNGSYGDSIDKYADLLYMPDMGEGMVGVKIFSSGGKLLAEYGGPWGQQGDVAQAFEFYLPMAGLQIYPSQPVRFYLAAAGLGNDRLPAEGDVQWKVFPVVTKSRLGIALFALIWLLATIMLYRYRVWSLFYVVGAVGFTFLFILIVRGSYLEYALEYWTGMILYQVLKVFDILAYVFDKSPGTILVFIKLDKSWTTINIDIESSALFEIAVLLGLVLFYPAYGYARKIYYALAGMLTLACFNLMRLLLIISIIYWGGRSFNFVAHTLFGRVFFFAVIVVLYWHILTQPTIKKVQGDVKDA